MKLEELNCSYYFFNSANYGRIFVFVDFGNVRPWAEDFWPEENKKKINIEIDIAKLAVVCNWANPSKKFFYYGHFPERPELDIAHKYNILHRSSIFRINKAKKSGFLVQTKEIKMISNYSEDGTYIGKQPKCNFDVEVTMDMITKIERYDTIMLFSGDSDFGYLLKYLKSKDKKVVVVCTRNRMSKELEEVADIFVPAETLKEFLKFDKKTLRR